MEGVKADMFTLVTDHHPLIYLQTQTSLSRRQARWAEFLQRFTFRWLYRPGRLNVADAINRAPQLIDHQLNAFSDAGLARAIRTKPISSPSADPSGQTLCA